MGKRIFVGNLPFSATDGQLNELFSKHGEVVSAEIVKDRFTERSRGFGFVELENDAADQAVSQLNGTEYGGRQLKVNEAREREPRGGGGSYRGRSMR